MLNCIIKIYLLQTVILWIQTMRFNFVLKQIQKNSNYIITSDVKIYIYSLM